MVSCPAANRLAATRTTSMTSGVEPSGNVARARLGEDVVAGLAASVLDVRREPVVQELQRRVAERALGAADGAVGVVAALELLTERLVIGLGHAEEVGDHVAG